VKAVTYRDTVPGTVTSTPAAKGWEKLDLTKLFEGEFRMHPTGFYSSQIVAVFAEQEENSQAKVEAGTKDEAV
tara:strand:+ start:430 stop:648 length:219 start_codon:yes stop_codon:yes gene_type:complete